MTEVGDNESLHAVIPLVLLGIGQTGIVTRVETDGPLGDRLLSLGFLPETEVVLLRCAPLGDPLCYLVRGASLCLRKSEAQRIWVKQTL